MKKLKLNESGFITEILIALIILAALIYFAYTRVHGASH